MNVNDIELQQRVVALQQELERSRLTEMKLKSAQAHAKAVLDTAVDAIITIDLDGSIQSFNPAAERMFGYTAAEVLGQNIKLLMPPPYRDEHDDYIQHYLDTNDKKIIGIGREVEGLRKGGTVFPMDLAVSEIKLQDQHHFTGIIRDISERKQAALALKQREEEARQNRERLAHISRISTMGEMATGIAHEINQPLTAIASYAQACRRMIQTGSSHTDELLRTMDKISVQAQRAGDVIQRLRNFIRKRESKRELCDLNALVRETILLAETDARVHDFRVEVALHQQSLLVVVDPIQIQQVILNLLRNAMEAMAGVADASESVTVTVATALHDPKAAQVLVTDRGTGVTEEIAERMFHPFFTTKSTGMGMGLSISRSIITSHGGSMGVAGNPERGITVYFTLPRADDD